VLVVAVLAAIAVHSRSAFAVGCVGACSRPDNVQVSDLIIGVDIALGFSPVSQCPGFDADGDGTVGIVELLQGVQNAIGGCFNPHYNPDKCSKAPPLSPVLVGDSAVLSTDTATRATTDPEPSCGCAASPHTAWTIFTPEGSGTATITVRDNAAATVLTAFSGTCSEPAELACSGDADGSTPPATLSVSAGMTYLVEVSTPCDGAGGSLRVAVDVCGDGVVSRGEQCDDGNTVDGDGCSASCVYEELFGYDFDAGCAAADASDINLFLVAPIAQRFVPFRGLLGGVDVLLNNISQPQEDTIVLNLRADDLGSPIIASASALVTRPGTAWQHFRFDPAVSVTIGAVYVLELVASNESINVHRRSATDDCPFAYPNGGAIYGGNPVAEDLIFRTYAARSP